MYRLGLNSLRIEFKRCNMNYSAERYLALKQFEREQKRDKIRALLWNVSIGSIYAMVVIQVFTGVIS